MPAADSRPRHRRSMNHHMNAGNTDNTPTEIRKPARILYIVMFAVFVLAPVVVFLFVQDYIDTENYEQRTLAAMPYSAESEADGVPTTIETFAEEFEDWFEDHLPFRNQLLTFYNEFEYRVLRTSTSENVVVGREGWLFYKGSQVAGEDPIGDYLGTNLLTEEELATIAANFTQMRDDLAAMGSEFYLYLAPNKERVYSEYMPDMYGEPSEYSKIDQLADYLNEHTDLVVVSSYDDIMAYKEANPDEQLYYKYETHWNAIGAYVGAEQLVRTMGFGFTEMEYCTLATIDYADYDLARLLHLQNVLDSEEDPYYVLSGYTPHVMRLTLENDGSVIRYNTTDGTAPGRKLFIIGDSFSAVLMPYVGCHFLDSYMTYYYNYAYETLLEEEPSVVLYEVVERYIGNLVDFNLYDGYTGTLIEG